MNNMKAWYNSKTIWGALIAVFAPLIQLAGVPLPIESQDELANGLVTVVGGIGGLLALYGRLSATDRLQ